jgi:UDP-glucose 4-epimerase
MNIKIGKVQKRLLLIGGAGFLGNSIAEWANRKGMSVTVVDEKYRIDSYSIAFSGVNYVSCDWPVGIDHINFEAFDVVIHLRWSSNPASSMNNIYDDATENIMGTIALLEAIPNNSVEKFIFMSSGGAVYGDLSGKRLSETNATKPISPYGISKVAIENYVNLYGNKKNFSPINIRLGNPYGSYQFQGTPVGAIANFVKKALNGEPICLYGDGSIIRDYIYIDDFNDAMCKIIEADFIEGTFNLGSGMGVSLAEIISSIKVQTDKNLKINYLESRSSDVRSVVLDNSKLDQLISLKDLTSIHEGIEIMVNKFQNIRMSESALMKKAA